MQDLTGIRGGNVALNVYDLLSGHLHLQSEILVQIGEREYDYETRTWQEVGLHATTALQCSDTFFWGSADAEEVTAETLPVLEQVVADLAPLRAAANAAGEAKRARFFEYAVSDLYASRIRGMRPQGAVYTRRYSSIPEVWPMFDAAGPEREVGFGNPIASPDSEC